MRKEGEGRGRVLTWLGNYQVTIAAQHLVKAQSFSSLGVTVRVERAHLWPIAPLAEASLEKAT